MTQRPNRPAERLSGFVAAACSAPWAFGGVLKIIDWISRAQTTATIAPYLWIFGTPAAFLGEFVLLVCSLVYATRLEHFREIDETTLIILAYSDPPEPKRHRKWIKLTVAITLLSAISAFIVFLQYSSRLPAVVARVPDVGATKQAPVPPADPKKTPSPKGKMPTAGTRSTAPPSATNKGVPAKDTPKPQVPITIPVPSQSPPQTPVEHDATEPIAMINGKPMRSNEKKQGTLYVSIKLSEASLYHGTLKDQDLRSVGKALENTGKVSVFIGEYNLKGATRTYSIGSFGDGEERTIYYFDQSLQPSCVAIQSISAGVIGKPLKCQFRSIDRPPAGRIDVRFDFIIASGLDCEIIL